MYWLGNVLCFATKLSLKQDLLADAVEKAQGVRCMLINMKQKFRSLSKAGHGGTCL